MGLLDKVSGMFNKQQPTDPLKDSTFGDQIASYVNDEYTRRMSERRAFELQWRINTEFINGNQYLEIDPATQTIAEIPKLWWYQEREVFNQIATIVETRIAKLTRQKPIMKVRPASGDDKDISAARVSSMLMTSSWHDQDMDGKYNDMVTWLEHTGTVFLKPVWDVHGGRLMGKQPLPPEQQAEEKTDGLSEQEVVTPPEIDQAYGLDQQVMEIREGDIETTVVPPHEIFPDSSYRDGLHLCRSVIHARAYHIEEIEEMWGVEVEPEDVDVMTLQRAQSSIGGMGYGTTTMRTAVSRLKNHAVLKEYYERPTSKYSQGRFIVVCGSKTLHVGPMPYMLGQDGEPEIPLIRVISIHRPGIFWGGTIAERCLPIQRRYNALRNRKAEYLNLVTIGAWYEPEGSVDDDAELNNAPGNRIRYRPVGNGARPEPVQFPSLPNSFEREEQTLLSEFTAVSGVSELSRFGQAPSGVKSGVALGIANEQDDTRTAVTAARMANAVTNLGKYWIRLYRQYVQEPRILRSVGSQYDVEVREWEVSDLTSDDVIIENVAALAETPAQRRQMVFDLLSAGLFTRPEMSNLSEESRRKVFELLEFGNWEGGGEDVHQLQVSRARRENKAMMQGQMSPVMDFDDHQLHIEQHNRQRMMAEYEQLLKNPQVGQMIDQMMRMHLAQHVQALMAQMPQVAQPANGGQQQQQQQA